MRKSIGILAALVLCNLAPAAQGEAPNAPKLVQTLPRAGDKPVSAMRIGLNSAAPSVSRGQIAVCANLAAIRGLSAKAAGADYAAQSRVLDLTFLLCLAGTPNRD